MHAGLHKQHFRVRSGVFECGPCQDRAAAFFRTDCNILFSYFSILKFRVLWSAVYSVYKCLHVMHLWYPLYLINFPCERGRWTNKWGYATREVCNNRVITVCTNPDKHRRRQILEKQGKTCCSQSGDLWWPWVSPLLSRRSTCYGAYENHSCSASRSVWICSVPSAK